MFSESAVFKGRSYQYSTEKRTKLRIPFDSEIYYPHINSNKIQFDIDGPVMKVINLSMGGVGLLSQYPLNKGDFVSFLLTLNNSISFECFAEVRWVCITDEGYVVGCQFYLLNNDQTAAIMRCLDEYCVKNNI